MRVNHLTRGHSLDSGPGPPQLGGPVLVAASLAPQPQANNAVARQ